MPRKRAALYQYQRCECCGALHPSKYECDCPQSKLMRRIFELFPGTEDITHEQIKPGRIP